MDANGDARIGFDEFVRVMAPLLQDAPTAKRLSSVIEDARGTGARQVAVHVSERFDGSWLPCYDSRLAQDVQGESPGCPYLDVGAYTQARQAAAWQADAGVLHRWSCCRCMQSKGCGAGVGAHAPRRVRVLLPDSWLAHFWDMAIRWLAVYYFITVWPCPALGGAKLGQVRPHQVLMSVLVCAHATSRLNRTQSPASRHFAFLCISKLTSLLLCSVQHPMQLWCS